MCQDLAVQSVRHWPSAESSAALSACLPFPSPLTQSKLGECEAYQVHIMIWIPCYAAGPPLPAIIFILSIILVFGARWKSCPKVLPHRAPEILEFYLSIHFGNAENALFHAKWASVSLEPYTTMNMWIPNLNFARLVEARMVTNHKAATHTENDRYSATVDKPIKCYHHNFFHISEWIVYANYNTYVTVPKMIELYFVSNQAPLPRWSPKFEDQGYDTVLPCLGHHTPQGWW